MRQGSGSGWTVVNNQIKIQIKGYISQYKSGSQFTRIVMIINIIFRNILTRLFVRLPFSSHFIYLWLIFHNLFFYVIQMTHKIPLSQKFKFSDQILRGRQGWTQREFKQRGGANRQQTCRQILLYLDHANGVRSCQNL